jgi:hypothetical protein
MEDSDKGLNKEELEALRIEAKILEKLEAKKLIEKIEELEKHPEKADELNKMIVGVKKTYFYSCKKEDIDKNKTPADQAKICLGYFINPRSATITEAVRAAPDNLLKSIMKSIYRQESPGSKGGKRSRKYKRKSIKKLRKKSRHNIKRK